MISKLISFIHKSKPAEPDGQSQFTAEQIEAAITPLHNIICQCPDCSAPIIKL